MRCKKSNVTWIIWNNSWTKVEPKACRWPCSFFLLFLLILLLFLPGPKHWLTHSLPGHEGVGVGCFLTLKWQCVTRTFWICSAWAHVGQSQKDEERRGFKCTIRQHLIVHLKVADDGWPAIPLPVASLTSLKSWSSGDRPAPRSRLHFIS